MVFTRRFSFIKSRKNRCLNFKINHFVISQQQTRITHLYTRTHTYANFLGFSLALWLCVCGCWWRLVGCYSINMQCGSCLNSLLTFSYFTLWPIIRNVVALFQLQFIYLYVHILYISMYRCVCVHLFLCSYIFSIAKAISDIGNTRFNI